MHDDSRGFADFITIDDETVSRHILLRIVVRHWGYGKGETGRKIPGTKRELLLCST